MNGRTVEFLGEEIWFDASVSDEQVSAILASLHRERLGGKTGDTGIAGLDASDAQVEMAAEKWLSKNIFQPADGKDADFDDIRAAVAQYVCENPPRDGKDGEGILGIRFDGETVFFSTTENRTIAIRLFDGPESGLLRRIQEITSKHAAEIIKKIKTEEMEEVRKILNS